jgi:hypothetical protein
MARMMGHYKSRDSLKAEHDAIHAIPRCFKLNRGKLNFCSASAALGIFPIKASALVIQPGGEDEISFKT